MDLYLRSALSQYNQSLQVLIKANKMIWRLIFGLYL